MSNTEGVSVEFFAKATRLLVRQHGNRLIAPDGTAERFRAALAEAERTFLALPLAPKRERPKRR